MGIAAANSAGHGEEKDCEYQRAHASRVAFARWLRQASWPARITHEARGHGALPS